MVVLENNYGMLSNTNNENHYLMPDPVTPTLDPKSSPLALLAQTCSQIGADCSNSKPILSSLDRKKSSSTNSNASSDRSLSTSSITKSHSAEHRSPENKLAFKPYELNVVTRRSDSSRPPSSHGDAEDRKSSSRTSSRKSASASPHAASTPNEKSSSSPPSSSSTVGTDTKPPTPVELAASKSGAPASIDPYSSLKDTSSSNSSSSATNSSSPFKPPYSLSPLPNFGCNGCPTLPLDPANPAFRSLFPNGGAAHPHLPHAAAAAALLDPSCFQSSTPSPYMSYTRVKTPTGGEAVVPVCKDPYCIGCRFSMHGALGPCPPGCMQCDQKYGAAAAAMLMSNPFSAYHQYGRPLVCSVMTGDQYCGKRCRSSEELLQHLRTHAASAADPIALMNHLRYSSAMAPLASGAAAAAAVAAASRYHPYSKPGTLPVTPLGASPFSAFNPTLSPYYPPYSLYDQRIGAAVNP